MKQDIDIRLRIDTLDAIVKLVNDEDYNFGLFVDDLRNARDNLQECYNYADLTKPVPTAEIKGMLLTLNMIIRKVDNCQKDVVDLRKREELERRKATATGGEVHHPIADAIPPGER